MHLDWCGPCEIMENNYRSLFFALVNATERIEFFTASNDILPEDIKTKMQFGPLTCKPRFAIFMAGEKKCEIDGADYTTLETNVNKFIPQMDE